MKCLHARQEVQLDARPPFKTNTQHAHVKGKSQVCNMLSSYLAPAAFHLHEHTVFLSMKTLTKLKMEKENKNKCGHKEILTTEVEGARLKTLKMLVGQVSGGWRWRVQQVCIDPLCALPQKSSKSSRRCRDRKEGWRTVKRWKGPAWPWGHWR